MLFTSLLPLFPFAAVALADNIVITVGGNTTDNAGMVFNPQSVTAKLGDTVVFNFTQGNHTATEAAFFAPCIPVNEADPTRNGFQSGFRNVTNGTAGEILTVPITPDIQNRTLWFFDYNTCGGGGVGVINANESSDETLDGFQRNAVRLNGSESSSTSSSSSSRTATSSGSSPSQTTDDNSTKVIAMGSSGLALGAVGIVLLWL